MGQDGTRKQQDRGGRGVSEGRGIAPDGVSEAWDKCFDAASMGKGSRAERRVVGSGSGPVQSNAEDAERCEAFAEGVIRGTAAREVDGDDDRCSGEGAWGADPKKIWGQVVALVLESEKASQQMLCGLLGRSRQGYYKLRCRVEREAIRAELVIQEVVSMRSVQERIGVRKVYHMLQPFLLEQQIKMGRDQLGEVMREHGLLVRKRRLRKPRTTISCWWRRYPNLIRDYVPTGANQLWVSDITYVRVGTRFGFLSLVTDGYSRRIVGYKLFRDLSARGCVGALRMALRNNPQRDGLIHHSDRGMQYSSTEYVKLLGKARISMTEKGDPRENAIAERVNGILKDELLDQGYQNFKEAREGIERAVSIYNHLRPHSSVDYLTPAEAHMHTGELKKRWKNYFSVRTNGPNAQAMA